MLEECAQRVLDLAREFRIWAVLGSAHRLTAPHKPHNSLYIIDDLGRVVDRYDKMFCSGDRSEQTEDLAHYSPGSHFSVFSIKGVRCGALICHDYRYPEIYREYKRKGVQLMFHSYHAGNIPPERFQAMKDGVGDTYRGLNSESTLPGITMPATMVAEAANNHVWISCPNSSARESCWPSFFAPPGRRYRGPIAATHGGRAGFGSRHGRIVLRLHGSLAGPGDGRCLAQRHARARPAIRRAHAIMTSVAVVG